MVWDEIILNNKEHIKLSIDNFDLKFDLNIPVLVWTNNSSNHKLFIECYDGKFFCKSNMWDTTIYTYDEFISVLFETHKTKSKIDKTEIFGETRVLLRSKYERMCEYFKYTKSRC